MAAVATFTPVGALRGARRTLPIALSVFVVGLVFGALSRQTGLTPLEAAVMSALVFAGAAQFVALGMWSGSLPVVAIILTTLIVNLRHVLMGAALRPWFARLSPLRAYLPLYLMSDESWAISMREHMDGEEDAAFLLGSGLILLGAWLLATCIGSVIGSAIRDPARLGLDFAFDAAFLALLTGLWRGRSDLLPWGTAGLVAIAGSHLLPGRWYILLGGLAGSLVGALIRAD